MLSKKVTKSSKALGIEDGLQMLEEIQDVRDEIEDTYTNYNNATYNQ
jgi:hypothetical protein